MQTGSAPIYIGFGSMSDSDGKATGEMIVRAMRENKLRAVLAQGWAGLHINDHAQADDVFVLKSAPHEWLFPRVAGVVHHGARQPQRPFEPVCRSSSSRTCAISTIGVGACMSWALGQSRCRAGSSIMPTCAKDCTILHSKLPFGVTPLRWAKRFVLRMALPMPYLSCTNGGIYERDDLCGRSRRVNLGGLNYIRGKDRETR